MLTRRQAKVERHDAEMKDRCFVCARGWKGSKARSIGMGFKLYYYGVDRKRKGVGVIPEEENKECYRGEKSVGQDHEVMKVKYRSGGKSTQVDYILCRQCHLKEIGDFRQRL